MGAPGFWDDQVEAARVSTEHARVTRKLESYDALRKEVDDAAELLELDSSLEAEVSGEPDNARLEARTRHGTPFTVSTTRKRSPFL